MCIPGSQTFNISVPNKHVTFEGWKLKVKVKLLNCVQLFGTPGTVAYQAPLSVHGIFQAKVLEWVAWWKPTNDNFDNKGTSFYSWKYLYVVVYIFIYLTSCIFTTVRTSNILQKNSNKLFGQTLTLLNESDKWIGWRTEVSRAGKTLRWYPNGSVLHYTHTQTHRRHNIKSDH